MRSSSSFGSWCAALVGAALLGTAGVQPAAATICTVSGVGTAVMPPSAADCELVTPDGDMHIVDGLPAGGTILSDAVLESFSSVVETAGGTLGGTQSTYGAVLRMPLVGTGTLSGFSGLKFIPLNTGGNNVMHFAPRTSGDPVQAFDADLFRLFGQITGDPDFDLLRVTAGAAFGMPSPGAAQLTDAGVDLWDYTGYFDVTYRIDFIGKPGGPLGGHSGSTTGTVRFGASAVPEPSTALLVGLGGALLGAMRRARRRPQA